VAAQSKPATKPNPWAQISSPSRGSPESLGEYSSGCLRGASKLPLDGPGFQVMHPSRTRYYGHPSLVDFIQKLGAALHAEHVGDVLVGDLSQPRGGPAPGGHSSHQTGLDVDLWFWQPKAAESGPLPMGERESTKSRSILDPKTSSIQADQVARVTALLHRAADDARVERMFVHPIIKRAMCESAGNERAWLAKLRPWYGHDDHVHVRLACPAGAEGCVHQTSVSNGDGCKELDWWFSPAAQEDRKKGLVTYQSKVGKAPGMPAQCLKLLDPGQSVNDPPAHAARPPAPEVKRTVSLQDKRSP
jgi:penicillin-insensitive murein endopeptidase